MDLLEIKRLLEKNITVPIKIGAVIDGNGVGLFSTSGYNPTFFMDNSITEYLGLQIISRNQSYSEGERILNNIFMILNRLEGFEPQQSPFFIGRDEKGRADFSVNYIITKEGAK